MDAQFPIALSCALEQPDFVGASTVECNLHSRNATQEHWRQKATRNLDDRRELHDMRKEGQQFPTLEHWNIKAFLPYIFHL
jgi:hypothetical protein